MTCTIPYSGVGPGMPVFPVLDTNADPQHFQFTLIADQDVTYDYFAVPDGTVAMSQGDPSQPLFKESDWVDETVLLGSLTVNDVQDTNMGGLWNINMQFMTNNFANSCQVSLLASDVPNEARVIVTGSGGQQVIVVENIPNGTNVRTTLYVNTSNKRIGLVYNDVDYGYISDESFVEPDLVIPDGDLFGFLSASDSTFGSVVERPIDLYLTFTKSLMGNGLPENSFTLCGDEPGPTDPSEEPITADGTGTLSNFKVYPELTRLGNIF